MGIARLFRARRAAQSTRQPDHFRRREPLGNIDCSVPDADPTRARQGVHREAADVAETDAKIGEQTAYLVADAERTRLAVTRAVRLRNDRIAAVPTPLASLWPPNEDRKAPVDASRLDTTAT
jgi:hypothetical protein